MSSRLAFVITLLSTVLSACGPAAIATPSPSATTAAPTSPPPATPTLTAPPTTSPTLSPAGRIRVLVSTDMAADDIVAIAAMLRDPGVDVRAIAVTGTGEAHCPAGARNVQRLLDAFGMSDIPVGCGRADAGSNGRTFPDEWRVGADNMYGMSLPPPSTTATADSAQLIVDTANASDRGLTVVAIGPWTDVADALAADPSIASTITIHAMGGALEVAGNIDYSGTTPADGVEWNLGVDPAANAAVLGSGVPISLVPLDATNDVPAGADFANDLASDQAAAGADIINELVERNPFMTSGFWYIWDPLAVLTLTAPDLVTWQEFVVVFEQTGPARGRLIADPAGQPIQAAVSADPDRVFDALLAALRRGAPRP